MKKAAFYDPYLDTGGGGERYVLTFARALIKNGWKVDFQWKDKKTLPWLEERLGMDLSGINIVDNVSRGAGYDLIFWISDGSIPLLLAKKNILHFQTPFKDVGGKSIFNKLKLLRVNNIICNSQYTKSFIDKEFAVNSTVLYPPVSLSKNTTKVEKEKIIIYVGRYSRLQQAKGQEILIEVFKDMCKKGLKNWRLVLIGGSSVGAGDIVPNLKKTAQGYPIDVLENLPYKEVIKFYEKASLYWSASGYGIDEQSEPARVEHFGITVVEAMTHGAVPVIVKKGGHEEIVANGQDGLIWENTEELITKTQELIIDERRLKQIANKAREKAKKFSEEEFEKNLFRYIK
ncbi:MAG: Uncharacterized protein G01um10145_668 [Microgenomates group bacterium Gr01-1014_5]|nr:MAG: Uncharacterized protein G01um10145_668 [Microgenomates group bacterium Gr01-1014_5]